MDPLILTLMLDEAAQAGFDRLRARHFPPGRTQVGAHVTLFHALPGDAEAEIASVLAAEARAFPPSPVRVASLRSLGHGVAFALESVPVQQLRARLARRWSAWLTPQDRQGYRPHVTVQNKADRAQAKALLDTLSASFTPHDVTATGLALFRYRGGPWEPAGIHAFTGPAEPP